MAASLSRLSLLVMTATQPRCLLVVALTYLAAELFSAAFVLVLPAKGLRDRADFSSKTDFPAWQTGQAWSGSIHFQWGVADSLILLLFSTLPH